MKKFYLTLVTALTATLTISASAPTPIKALKAEEPTRQAVTESKVEKIKSDRSTVNSTDFQPMASPTGEWVKISTGIWFEGPMAGIYNDVSEGQWEVDVYESATTKGWYRVYPYVASCQLAQLLGRADTQYALDICAVNPSKVYIESWTPYNMVEFCSYATEAGFSGSNYGTLSDGVITFESRSLVLQLKSNPTGWSIAPEGFKLVLDASTYKDYSINFEAPLCSSESEQYIRFAIGEDVANVKLVCLEGLYPMNAANASIVAQSGDDITSYANSNVSLGLTGPNTMYSLLYVTLDASGTVREKGVKYAFIVENDDENWEDVGQAVYSEAIVSELFSDIETEQLTCTVQRHKTTADYFRLVNPYKSMSVMNPISSHSHNHYLYLNATDPDHVYIEPSVLGLNINSTFGDAAALSWGYSYLDKIEQGETDDVWGKLDKTAGTITIPAGNMRLLLTNYNNGSFLTPDPTNDFLVTFPEGAFSGIDELNVDSDSNAPVEYFNLQGIKISNPTPGQIYIKRQGSKVGKAYIK